MGDNIAVRRKKRQGVTMANFKKCLACFALLFWAPAMPVLAASSAASSASDSLSTSVGSISGSIQKSSDSSSKANDVAEGDYKIIDVAAVSERPGIVRMKLQALVDQVADREFFLYLPQKAFDQGNLGNGRIVTVRKRSYGGEFANRDTRQVFFLVLTDDWYRELQANAVVL
jgi:hypothetical protein